MEALQTVNLTQLWDPLRDVLLQPTFIHILILLTTYLVVASKLRFHRAKSLYKQFSYPTRESMAHMTDNDAWKIQKTILQLEFPLVAYKSIQFALFRTYGIPTISALLIRTGQFSDPQTAFKRYADTSILIGEFMASEPTSERAKTAIARTNYLHKGYRASGTILDDDMLYTLSLFASEPIRFIELYEWRSVTELEKCAIGTFWKSLGDALQISYEKLPSYRAGFSDGIHWLEEVTAWSRAYEKEKMAPHLRNKEIADQTVEILLYGLPDLLKPLGYWLVSFVMDDQLRDAMLYKPPPPALCQFLNFCVLIRKLTIRYLALPRPYFMRYDYFTEKADINGHYYLLIWDAAPYYVKPTIWNKWGPTAWLTWARGLPLPGDEGQKYYPGGYNIADLGPQAFEGKGKDYLEESMETLEEQRGGGCPFHVYN